MRIVDLDRELQYGSISLFITRDEAVRFLEQLRGFLDAEPGPQSRVDLVDRNDGSNAQDYRPRTIALMKYDPKRGGADAWPDGFRQLVLDDDGKLSQVGLGDISSAINP
ncbi:MAG: hypothetical protein WC655_04240 [Candidatus Hydrogenedentales bacterium]|jgi:hypothetical protein